MRAITGAILIFVSSLPATVELFAGPLTPAEEARILAGHNRIRSDIANGQVGDEPTSSNMAGLLWDDDLARIARDWADACTFAHNPDRTTRYQTLSGSSDYVGENLYATTNASDVPDAALAAWLGEHTSYTYGPVTGSGSTGHYTQLAWANTLRVGCARAACPYLFSSTSDQFLVCDYAPGGNFINQYPYESGAPASNCPPDRPYAISGLCMANVADSERRHSGQ